ncbi:hypothetical protein DNTS_028412 [Danionella cerebrum]|uniref:Uncharacterized protein n=1 Tax=Danionella cerebrum TaxID=2873325 RepID=A0A553NW37_9TELE|nr:hypothetical protein DNTS_028412 [Danionella translucida]
MELSLILTVETKKGQRPRSAVPDTNIFLTT